MGHPREQPFAPVARSSMPPLWTREPHLPAMQRDMRLYPAGGPRRANSRSVKEALAGPFSLSGHRSDPATAARSPAHLKRAPMHLNWENPGVSERADLAPPANLVRPRCGPGRPGSGVLAGQGGVVSELRHLSSHRSTCGPRRTGSEEAAPDQRRHRQRPQQLGAPLRRKPGRGR